MPSSLTAGGADIGHYAAISKRYLSQNFVSTVIKFVLVRIDDFSATECCVIPINVVVLSRSRETTTEDRDSATIVVDRLCTAG